AVRHAGRDVHLDASKRCGHAAATAGVTGSAGQLARTAADAALLLAFAHLDGARGAAVRLFQSHAHGVLHVASALAPGGAAEQRVEHAATAARRGALAPSGTEEVTE